ncbi:MAG: universal stress protein [Pseudomonadota bacterium]
MSYKTIIVNLANAENAERMTEIAVSIARKFNAHLIGLHTLQSIEIYPSVSMYMPQNISKSFDEDQAAEGDKIRDIFLNLTGKEDFVSEWRCVKASAPSAGKVIIDHSRTADLIIMAQPDESLDRADQTTIQREVIEESGRPVLIIPKAGRFNHIGDHILIGWSATKEAARAVHDAIPFAQKGAKASIFWVSKSNQTDNYLADTGHQMAICLDRHGVKAEVTHRVQLDLPIGDEILNEAADTGADMIVSGAYGHSRVYDFMVGATTPHLMKHMTVPVLFSS